MRPAAPRATLVEEHGMEPGICKQRPVLGLAAASRPAVQEDDRNAFGIAHRLHINLVAIARFEVLRPEVRRNQRFLHCHYRSPSGVPPAKLR